MDPKEQIRLTMEGAEGPDVLARRRARMTFDPLAHRTRSAALWKSGPWPHDGISARTFYRHPGFRRYLMPGVRARQDACEAAHRAQHVAEMEESERRWKYAKALKEAKPLSLFECPIPHQSGK